MLRGFDCVHRTPSRSHASQKIARMSAERFEEVARIRVLGDATARQLRLEAVDGAAAVGVDESADELVGMLVGDLMLPGLEDDRPVVLPARAVLRERSGPPVPPALDQTHVAVRHAIRLHAPPKAREDEGRDAVLHDPRARPVQEDPQELRSARDLEVAVSEVQAEQICVGSPVGRAPVELWTGAERRSLPGRPANDGGIRNPGCASCVGRRQPTLEKASGLGHLRLAHSSIVSTAADAETQRGSRDSNPGSRFWRPRSWAN